MEDKSCKCECKIDDRKFNSNQNLSKDKLQCECKKQICQIDYIWNPSNPLNYNSWKYLASITDDLVITHDKVKDTTKKSNDKETKAVPTNFNRENIICKTQNFYILLVVLLVYTLLVLITIALLKAISICCYLIKY